MICGGESGPGARPIRLSWVTSIRDQCQAANVPFFFKQWGGVHKSVPGRLLEGRTYDQYPPRIAGPMTTKGDCQRFTAEIVAKYGLELPGLKWHLADAQTDARSFCSHPDEPPKGLA